MLPALSVPTPIEVVDLPAFASRSIELYVKRDDLIHPDIIGNKLRKSLPHLHCCIQQKFTSMITFGGRYSNHLLAIAKAGQECGIKTFGVVRGTDLRGGSEVLDECVRCGMQVLEAEADEYQALQTLNAADLSQRLQLDVVPYVIPEGGTAAVSINGTAAIIDEIPELSSWDWIVTAVGTGGTAAGLVWGLAQQKISALPRLLAFSVLKGFSSLPEPGMKALVEMSGPAVAQAMVARHLTFDGSAPFGRYGKPAVSVMSQLQTLQKQIHFPIDFVYTGKALLQLEQKVSAGQFTRGSRILFLHTGGYQTAAIAS